MRRSGFTLVELAIVLVIVGLMTGGVLTARDLMRNASHRGVIKEAENYKRAAAVFKVKYNCYPGDCTKLAEYGLSCCGNGNDIINYNSGESYLFWSQLAQAKIISGSYVPWGSGNFDCAVGRTCPASAYFNGVWDIMNWDNCVAGWCMTNQVGNVLMYGKLPTATWLVLPMAPLISALDAKQIDEKADDGLPKTGMIASIIAAPCTNAGGTVYDLTGSLNSDAISCALTFNRVF